MDLLDESSSIDFIGFEVVQYKVLMGKNRRERKETI